MAFARKLHDRFRARREIGRFVVEELWAVEGAGFGNLRHVYSAEGADGWQPLPKVGDVHTEFFGGQGDEFPKLICQSVDVLDWIASDSTYVYVLWDSELRWGGAWYPTAETYTTNERMEIPQFELYERPNMPVQWRHTYYLYRDRARAVRIVPVTISGELTEIQRQIIDDMVGSFYYPGKNNTNFKYLYKGARIQEKPGNLTVIYYKFERWAHFSPAPLTPDGSKQTPPLGPFDELAISLDFNTNEPTGVAILGEVLYPFAYTDLPGDP